MLRLPLSCAFAALVVLLVEGCAGENGGGATPLAADAVTGAAPATAPIAGPVAYQLTDEEKGLDCKKLTGRMQVRILQVRDYGSQAKASSLSQGMQKTSSVLGGTTAAADPDDAYRTTVAQLQAYNAQLAAKGCKTFDLAEELKPKAVTATPTPVAKDAGKAQGKTDPPPVTAASPPVKTGPIFGSGPASSNPEISPMGAPY